MWLGRNRFSFSVALDHRLLVSLLTGVPCYLESMIWILLIHDHSFETNYISFGRKFPKGWLGGSDQNVQCTVCTVYILQKNSKAKASSNPQLSIPATTGDHYKHCASLMRPWDGSQIISSPLAVVATATLEIGDKIIWWGKPCLERSKGKL